MRRVEEDHGEPKVHGEVDDVGGVMVDIEERRRPAEETPTWTLSSVNPAFQYPFLRSRVVMDFA